MNNPSSKIDLAQEVFSATEGNRTDLVALLSRADRLLPQLKDAITETVISIQKILESIKQCETVLDHAKGLHIESTTDFPLEDFSRYFLLTRLKKQDESLPPPNLSEIECFFPYIPLLDNKSQYLETFLSTNGININQVKQEIASIKCATLKIAPHCDYDLSSSTQDAKGITDVYEQILIDPGHIHAGALIYEFKKVIIIYEKIRDIGKDCLEQLKSLLIQYQGAFNRLLTILGRSDDQTTKLDLARGVLATDGSDVNDEETALATHSHSLIPELKRIRNDVREAIHHATLLLQECELTFHDEDKIEDTDFIHAEFSKGWPLIFFPKTPHFDKQSATTDTIFTNNGGKLLIELRYAIEKIKRRIFTILPYHHWRKIDDEISGEYTQTDTNKEKTRHKYIDKIGDEALRDITNQLRELMILREEIFRGTEFSLDQLQKQLIQIQQALMRTSNPVSQTAR